MSGNDAFQAVFETVKKDDGTYTWKADMGPYGFFQNNHSFATEEQCVESMQLEIPRILADMESFGAKVHGGAWSKT